MACRLLYDKPLSEPALTYLLSVGHFGTNLSEFSTKIQWFSLKINLKIFSATCRPSCLGLIVLYDYMTICVRWPSYSGQITSISCVLMTWLHASPRQQQPWCYDNYDNIGRSLSSMQKHFSHRCCSVKEFIVNCDVYSYLFFKIIQDKSVR